MKGIVSTKTVGLTVVVVGLSSTREKSGLEDEINRDWVRLEELRV